MVFFVATVLLCLFILFYVIRLNIVQGKGLRKWDFIDWIRLIVAGYWIFVSVKLAIHFELANPHTTIYPGVVLTLALVAATSIRKQKRINGNGQH